MLISRLNLTERTSKPSRVPGTPKEAERAARVSADRRSADLEERVRAQEREVEALRARVP